MSGQRHKGRAALARLGKTVGVSALTLGVMGGIWQGAIDAFHLSPFVAKGPVQVYDFLFNSPGGGSSARSCSLPSPNDPGRRSRLCGRDGRRHRSCARCRAAARRRSDGDAPCDSAPVGTSCRYGPDTHPRARAGLARRNSGRRYRYVFPDPGQRVPGAAFRSGDCVRHAFRLTGQRISRSSAKPGFPYALPAIFASARIAGPGALLGAILAEWFATDRASET